MEAGIREMVLYVALEEAGILNVVVDSSGIATKRRGRHATTDRLDAGALVKKLVEYCAGKRRTSRVVHVPPGERRGAPKIGPFPRRPDRFNAWLRCSTGA